MKAAIKTPAQLIEEFDDLHDIIKEEHPEMSLQQAMAEFMAWKLGFNKGDHYIDHALEWAENIQEGMSRSEEYGTSFDHEMGEVLAGMG